MSGSGSNTYGDATRRGFLAMWNRVYLLDLAIELKMAPQVVERLLLHHGETIHRRKGWRLLEPAVAARFRNLYGSVTGALSATEVAARAGLDRRTVASACRSGRLAHIEVPGRATFLIAEADALAYIAKHGRLQEAAP